MTPITTYRDALAAIWARSGYDRGFISNPFAGEDAARLGLRRTDALLHRLGNPERNLRIIHVAGSKGKGSTCMMTDAILRAAGLRAGRFLSPHLHSYRERFVVDDEPIPESDFAELTARSIDAAEEVERSTPELGQITAFELSTAMALAWFAANRCDVAVVEVGLGGTLDSTNVVEPEVSVITALDFEHTAILGSTMTEIASNKAGIIKPGRPVVSAAQPAEGMAVIEDRASEVGSPLHIADRDWHISGDDSGFNISSPWGTFEGLSCSLAGAHQVENAALAIAAVSLLQQRHPSLAIDERAIRHGLANTRHPGRFEQVTLPSGQTVVIDGAHSPASAAALAKTMQQRFPEARATIVAGMFSDKAPDLILSPLRPCASGWIAVAPANPRALPADDIRSALASMGEACEIAAGVKEGLEQATRSGGDIILVTGSLATAAEARVALGLAPVGDEMA